MRCCGWQRNNKTPPHMCHHVKLGSSAWKGVCINRRNPQDGRRSCRFHVGPVLNMTGMNGINATNGEWTDWCRMLADIPGTGVTLVWCKEWRSLPFGTRLFCGAVWSVTKRAISMIRWRGSGDWQRHDTQDGWPQLKTCYCITSRYQQISGFYPYTWWAQPAPIQWK